jgi:hypothetical protein
MERKRMMAMERKQWLEREKKMAKERVLTTGKESEGHRDRENNGPSRCFCTIKDGLLSQLGNFSEICCLFP